jgi:hypothetical protein
MAAKENEQLEVIKTISINKINTYVQKINFIEK